MIMAMHDLINAICVHKLDDMQVGLHVMLGRTMLHTAACAPRACICKCNYCDMSQCIVYTCTHKTCLMTTSTLESALAH